MHRGDDGPWIIVSYLTLRRTLGVLGILLPIVLAAGWMLFEGRVALRPSVSSYYATQMGDVFVGTLFAAGSFLFAYRGLERRDNVAGNIAGVFAVIVALFPTTSPSAVVRTVHWLAAAGLFLTFAYFSIALFTKTHEHLAPTPEKLQRNRVYRICGWILVGCVVGVAVHQIFLRGSAIDAIQPAFWLETFALWAFGTSWLIKGETLLTDD